MTRLNYGHAQESRARARSGTCDAADALGWASSFIPEPTDRKGFYLKLGFVITDPSGREVLAHPLL